MLVREMKLDVEFKKVDLFKGENRTPEFLKLNPIHKVPVMQHGDVVATDSVSIMMYLVDQFKPDSSLFPKKLSHRTEVVNQLLFNSTNLFAQDSAVFRTIFHEADKDYSKYTKYVNEAYDCLETFLTKNQYVAGPELTIADFANITTASTLNILFPITSEKWPKTNKWMNEMSKLSYYDEINGAGLKELRAFLCNFLKLD